MITEDFPSDHGHHRGVFWAWHQVLVGDKVLGGCLGLKIFSGMSSRRTLQLARSKPPSPPPHCGNLLTLSAAMANSSLCVGEQAAIVVHAAEANVCSIDFNLGSAARDDVCIGGSDDDKGYGGFSPRRASLTTCNSLARAERSSLK